MTTSMKMLTIELKPGR
uniref:Uncharacterized protein n=1 Tax=Arundo donax TaxID=35708 RepID=A0A0A8YA58_ARUDO